MERACGFLGARHSFFLALVMCLRLHIRTSEAISVGIFITKLGRTSLSSLDLMWEKHNQEFDILRNRDAFQNPKQLGSKTWDLRIKSQKLLEKPLIICVCLSLACGRAFLCVCMRAVFAHTCEAISVGIFVLESRVAVREKHNDQIH